MATLAARRSVQSCEYLGDAADARRHGIRRVRRFRPTDCRQLTREAGEESNPWLLHSTTSCRLTRLLHLAIPIRTCRDARPAAWPSLPAWTRASIRSRWWAYNAETPRFSAMRGRALRTM